MPGKMLMRRERRCGAERRSMNRLNRLMIRAGAKLRDKSGVSTVEIILILVVLIALVIIFRDQLKSLVTSILGKITSQANGV